MIIVALLMKKSKISHIISLIIGGVIIAGIFFYIGYRTAYIRYENAEPAIITQTFYATISEITEDTVTVTGICFRYRKRNRNYLAVHGYCI